MTGSTVLVTGANGFLGRHLLDRLAGAEGVSVHAVSRSLPQDEHGRSAAIHWQQLDLADADRVRAVVREIAPAVIYHLASDNQGGREAGLIPASFRNDVQTTINVLMAAEELGCKRLVLPASLEDREAVPVSPYAAAKMTCRLYGQLFHSLYGLPVVFLRPFMTYGPGQKPYKLIPFAIRALLNGQSPAISSGARLVDWIYVDDVIEGFVRAAAAPNAAGSTIDLGSGVLVSVREAVEKASSMISSSASATFEGASTRGREIVRAAEMGPAKELLGWEPRTTLDEGLRRTIEWFRRKEAECGSY